MTNIGKYVDRSPLICPAGKLSGDSTDSVAERLKQFTVEDGIQALKHDAQIPNEEPFVYALPRLRDFRHKGAYTDIRPLLNPPVRTRYQTLVNDLKETSYASYWKQPLGKATDEVPGLPRGTSPHAITFGRPTGRTITMKDLVNPPKTPYEVLSESQIGHDLYRKSHNDYNPSERVERNYLKPAYDSNRPYGMKTKYDPRGIWVRCACNWIQKEPTVVVNDIEADYLEKTRPKLGKCLTPNNNISCVPEGHTFGIPSIREMYGVEDLLKDKECTPDLVKRDFMTWMISLNKLRENLRKQNSFEFTFDALYRKFLYYDPQETDCIPLSTFYQVCSCYHITFHKDSIENLLKVLGIICNERINYKKFIEIVNVQAPPMLLMKIDDVPLEHKYYLTTNQAATCDHLLIDNSKMPTAGIPTSRADLPYPPVPEGGCRADIENLGDDTTAEALISPSIFTCYGLTNKDFFMPRSQENIKKIFKNMEYEMDDDTFRKFWKAGVEHDKTGQVCVDTFYKLLKSNQKPPQIKVDERDCLNFKST